jgi:hypothetical protein
MAVVAAEHVPSAEPSAPPAPDACAQDNNAAADAPAHKRPAPEHDAELDDKELICAIRSLAGLT